MRDAELPKAGDGFSPLMDYWVDAAQRTILFWDVLRQRGNQYLEHTAQKAPNVLNYDHELVMDGRSLARPVNYGLVRIRPPEGVEIDPLKRPFVVVDPRAGHGPGIGGFKADSEIGVALAAGHACYIIGFLPEPVPVQTIEDVTRAEAAFLERVIALHPEAEGKPCVIGNCQGGWAVMMLAALHPEPVGPIVIAGAPLSYWAGVRGANPMRYSGGLLGGSWLTALTGDLGNGRFDGAWLVTNFESLDPANTLWTKPYTLYSKVDTEAPRYLGFERYWGGHVMLNAEEMQFISDELFIGNKLSSAEIVTSDGVRIDLRTVRSPIVVFCSRGDNITPPAQALGWILDLYDDVDDIRAHGQTIVYAVHDTSGHLGIFVSGKIARKEHEEFASNIDLIDVLPPGLYEAVLTPKTAETVNPELVSGDWVVRFEPRTLDHIRAFGGNDAEDDRRFATVARLSEINLGLYRLFLAPMIRAVASAPIADALRRTHPLRLQYELMSDANPFVRPLAAVAKQVREQRRPVAAENPYLAFQEQVSSQIVQALDAWRDLRDTTVERVFLAAYGSPLLQAFVGIGGEAGHVRPRAGENPLHQAFVEAKKAELRGRMGEGGLPEALIRALIYVGRAFGGTDERIFAAISRCRAEHSQSGAVPLDVFKQRVREQFFMLLLDEEAALAALPDLLPDDEEQRRTAFDVLGTVVTATGDLNKDARTRLARVAELFGLTEKGVDRRMEKGSEKVRARSAALTAPTPLRARRKKG